MMTLRKPKKTKILYGRTFEILTKSTVEKINWLLVADYPAKHKIQSAIFFFFQSL